MSKHIAVHWHALYVASRCEKVVAAQLRVLGIEAIVPVQKQTRQWSDRKKVADVILFPNYVFLAANVHQHEAVVRIDHVVGFVRFGGKIAALADREINLIKQIGQVEHPVVISNDTYCSGDEVEIISGPMKNHRGRILSTNGSTKVQIPIPSLQSCAQVVVGKGEVRNVGR